MIRFIKSLFAWRHIAERGAWAYEQNTITGKRRARRIAGIAGPRDSAWLAGRKQDLHAPSHVHIPPPPFRMPR